MMDRRAFLCGLTLGTMSAPFAAEAQQAAKLYRLGYLEQGSAKEPQPGYGWLRQGLRELGWIEGQNLVIEARFTEGKAEGRAALVADLLRLNVDAIVAPDTPTARAVKQATTTVPIVMLSGDPVAAGLVTSLAKPGGNVTGVANQMNEARAKAIETLLEAVPGISEIGYLVSPDNPAIVQGWHAAKAASSRLGVKLRRFDVSQQADLEKVIATMTRERIGAMVVPPAQPFISQRSLIGALAAKNRLPWLSGLAVFMDAGALMSYGPDQRDMWRRVVWYVDRILKGTSPADLPVEHPTKFELIISLKTAKALGLTIPQSLLLRADQVIE